MLKTLLTTTDPQNYELYFNEKIASVTKLFNEANISIPTPELFKSPSEFYRMRAEFAVFHEKDGTLSLCMFEKYTKKRLIINSFPIASRAINKAMDLVRNYIKDTPELKKKLFEVEFLATQDEQVVISLSYHRPLDEKNWYEAAIKFKEFCCGKNLNVNIVGRARKQTILANTDTVIETLHTKDKNFLLYQVEGNFSQPNIYTCEKMIDFVRNCCRDNKDHDLIELYCGSGTFTVCLSDLFRKAFATEVSRVPTATALKNVEKNNIKNIQIARLSAVEVAEAMNGVREFKRLKEAKIDIQSYDFKTLLIDPPRNGLEFKEARAFTALFDNVIYVSCGPKSLVEDLKYLTKTHNIIKVGFFDQFPYTEHLESIIYLKK